MVNAPQANVAPAKSSGAFKILLIVIGIFLGLGLLVAATLLYGVWRVSRSVNIDKAGGVTISTPQGKISAGQAPMHVTEAQAGAPLYPGANSVQGGFQIGGANGSMATYAFKTSDSVQQVLAFYRDKFGPKVAVVESPDGAVITSPKSDSEYVMVTIGRDSSDGTTTIAITHTTSNKAQ
jgi:hypothetical protein